MGDERSARQGVPIGRAWPAGPPAAGDGRGGRGRDDRAPDSSAATRRLFVAVPLDAAALRAVASLVAELRAFEAAMSVGRGAAGRPGLRWVRPEGVHVTLRFLGATPHPRTAAAVAALEDSVVGVEPFTIRIAGAGAYPRLVAPRVLWLGIAAGADLLADVAARLDRRLARAGWSPEERAFDAHLTLARANDAEGARQVAAELVRRAAALHVEWTADRAVLFESHPGPGGSRYEVVKTVPLAG
jgi:2'-5' RNA ligase